MPEILGEWKLDGVSWRLEEVSAPKYPTSLSLTFDSLLQGGMLLVNRQHPLPERFTEASLVKVNVEATSLQVSDEAMRLLPSACNALSEALLAAETQGCGDFILREGYRSLERQTELFENKLEQNKKIFQGDSNNLEIKREQTAPLSDEELWDETAKQVNPPGTSEYQTGLAFLVDVYKAEGKQTLFHKSPQGQWLKDHCWEYGIIPRFPTTDYPGKPWTDKSELTGVTADVSMYRYVGRPHAAIMRLMDLCMEEYVSFLAQHPNLKLYRNDSLCYELLRLEADQKQVYSLPAAPLALDAQAGFDNVGGIVIEYTYR